MTTTTDTPTIALDVLCAACGYDLRGLAPGGKCPECGFAIDSSLANWLEAAEMSRPLLRDADPKWLRGVADGLRISLVVFVLIAVLALLPERMYLGKRWRGEISIGLACAAWVLAAFGVWKVTQPLRGTGAKRVRTIWRPILRWCAMIYFASPLLPAIEERFGSSAEIAWLGLACIAAGVVASLMYFIYLGRIAGGCAGRFTMVHAHVLGGVSLMLAVYGISNLPRNDSFYGLLELPVFPYCTVNLLLQVTRVLMGGSLPAVYEFVPVAFVIWTAAVVFRVFVLLRQTARLAETPPSAAE